MTIKECEEFKRSKSDEEFKAWFKDAAWYHVTIDGIEHPCYKLTSKKAVLGSGDIYFDYNGTMRRYSDREEARKDFNLMLLMDVYKGLRQDDKSSLLGYAGLLRAKEAYEIEAEEKRDMAQRGEVEIRCSFCGKSRENVRKLIASPNETYICDECVEICTEIIEEEDEDEEQDNRD